MITVENLTKYYGDFPAVDNINLQIQKGEILGLLGPNGAGKTTTLRMLTCFFEPTVGTIKVKDLQVPQDTLKIKHLMGYLPESAPLYHNMLVFDYLNYVARVRELSRERTGERLKELSTICGLSEIMHKPVAELSRGLRQRVGLAHAMMADPEILVLDEPTSGLDPNQIAEIRQIIRKIGKEKTIVFSTHILSEAEATCDRIAIINRGKIVADDRTANLKQNAKEEFSITLCLRKADPSEAQTLLESVDEGIEVASADPPDRDTVKFKIKSVNNKDPMTDIYLKIKETDWIVTEFKKDVKTLENIFHELTTEEQQI